MNTLLQIHKNIYKHRTSFTRRMRHITCYTRHRKPELYLLIKIFEQYYLPDDLFEYFLDLFGFELFEQMIPTTLFGLSIYGLSRDIELPCWWCSSYYRELDDIDPWEARNDPNFEWPVQLG